MRIRRVAGATLALSAAFALSACLQFGDYAEGAECAPALDQLTTVVTDELAISWEPDSAYTFPTGYERPWCSEWVETGLDLAANDARREAVAARVAEIVAPLRSGAILTIEYAPGDRDTFTSPDTGGPSPAP